MAQSDIELAERIVVPGPYWNGVFIEPTFDVAEASRKFRRGGKFGLPRGQYVLLGHDDHVALLAPYRGIHPHHARWFWITEIRNLIPDEMRYSRKLPIVVANQDLRNPSVHHDAPPLDANLWRYMDMWKFEQMVRMSGIFLAKATTFIDPLEGTLSPANWNLRGDIYADDPAMASAMPDLARELEHMKKWTYISCWRIDPAESDRCWKEYVSKGEGVAVQTTYGRLSQFCALLFCARVQYVNLSDTWISEGNSLFPFMHKDAERFAWEKEFRIIVQRFPRRPIEFDQEVFFDCSQDNPNIGMTLQVDLKRFVASIIVAPNASSDVRSRVRQLGKEFGLEEKVKESRFDLG